MNDLRVEGIGTSQGGAYGKVKIDGISTINGDLTAEQIDIDGVSTVNGNVNGEKLDTDGVATINGNVDISELTCGGVVTVSGTVRTKSADIRGVLTVRGARVEADKVSCDGALTIDGELNAEIIEAEGYIKAQEIVGERVVIKSSSSKFLKFAQRFKNNLGVFNFIEATEIDLTKVHAKVVHGHNIKIGKKCQIDSLDCNGTLHIDPSAKVGTITGDYTLV